MQIFFINIDPVKAAKQLSDVHIRKMPTESAQLLSTAFRVIKPQTILSICKSYNPYGRLVKWLVASKAHYRWLLQHAIALCKEYTYRTDKVHASQTYIDLIAEKWNPVVMDQYKHLIVPNDPIQSNRNLLKIGKRDICHWKLKPARRPTWF
ncbi:MAG: hypothetical protein ACMG6E_06065 [Candidatus Roizmanbacteria bacterium]